jgi:RimJ/RimL family protein N-acetyltransferase
MGAMPQPLSPAANPAHVAFAPLTEADLPLLHDWLNAPHVVAGYSRVSSTQEDVAARYGPRIRGEVPIRGFVAKVGDHPIGYLQAYRVADFQDYAATVGGGFADAVAIDVLIGEVEYTRRGLGPRVIAAALDEIVWTSYPASTCVATPRADNTASVRAFAKAGFAVVRTIRSADGVPEVLMVRQRTRAAGAQDATARRP